MIASHTDLSDDRLAAEAAALVDTLLPGDATFPAASLAGAHLAFVVRWSERYGRTSLNALFDRIGAPGGPLRDAGGSKRAAAVAGFAAGDPQEFAMLRRIVYLSYYESPPVVAAIASLGHDYRATPQPDGYALPAFDAARDAPKHSRGAYMPTDAVARVDMSALRHLEPR